MIRKINSVFGGSKYNSMVHKVANKPPHYGVAKGLRSASVYYTLSALVSCGIFDACTTNVQQDKSKPKTEQMYVPSNPVTEVSNSKLAPNGNYTVKEGDTVWGIAKSLLKESCSDEVTDAQIYKKELEIMKLNNLKFPSDSCDCVIIHAGDVLTVKNPVTENRKVKDINFDKYIDVIANTLYQTTVH